MPKRFPIVPIGWRDAATLIRERQYFLLRYLDGHAELLNKESEAVFYLQRRSVELLDAARSHSDSQRRRR